MTPERTVAGQYEAWAYEHLRAADPDCRDEDDDHDDIPIRAGAPEAIGLTPRQLRAQTAEAVAIEDALRPGGKQ